MPKMKTNRGAAKRFRRTGSGKWTHNRTNRRHLLTKKNPKRIRRLRIKGIIQGKRTQQIDALVPYK